MSRAVSKSSSPDRRKQFVTFGVIAVVVAIIVAVALASRTIVPENATKSIGNAKYKVGDTAPQFTAQTNLGTFDLSTTSTPVLLEIFATWCPHCQRETAVLNALQAKYAGKLAIVAVSGDAFDMQQKGPETQADVNAFGAQFQVRYPIAFDPDLTVAQKYYKTGFPTIVLIDAHKKVRYISEGDKPQEVLEKAIAPVL